MGGMEQAAMKAVVTGTGDWPGYKYWDSVLETMSGSRHCTLGSED